MAKTADEVYNLLTAMNKTTLGRIGAEVKEIRGLLEAMNKTTLGRMEGELKDMQEVFKREAEIRRGKTRLSG